MLGLALKTSTNLGNEIEAGDELEDKSRDQLKINLMLHLLKSNQVQGVKENVANLNLTLIQLGHSTNTPPPSPPPPPPTGRTQKKSGNHLTKHNDDDDSKIAVIRVNNFMPNILARSPSLAHTQCLALIRVQRSRERLRVRERASERAGERAYLLFSCRFSHNSAFFTHSFYLLARRQRQRLCLSPSPSPSQSPSLSPRLSPSLCGSFPINKARAFRDPVTRQWLSRYFPDTQEIAEENIRKHHSKTFSDRQRQRTVACEVPRVKTDKNNKLKICTIITATTREFVN